MVAKKVAEPVSFVYEVPSTRPGVQGLVATVVMSSGKASAVITEVRDDQA